ncbi:MAG: ferredoxin [Candidatus Lokiarchaeota archaeon]|nr:ferredoxin [Candidatus Lokiarchaeota archaeon]
MNSVIYYFSGTGNSLHVARELKKRLPNARLIPIVGALKSKKTKINADTVGIVFPIHAHTFPWVVEKFLNTCDLSSASYLFGFATRECADNVFSDMDKILMNRQTQLTASFAVETPVNFIPVFAVPTEEEILQIENRLQEKLDIIAKLIRNKISYHEETGALVSVLANTFLRVSQFVFQKTGYFGLQRAYYANEKCIGCGTCEKICLSNKISLVNKKPIWKQNIPCLYCFACISYCPTEAIQAKRLRTTKKGRYHHPDIKATEISKQKLPI